MAVTPEHPDPSRRKFLRQAAGAVATSALGVLGVGAGYEIGKLSENVNVVMEGKQEFPHKGFSVHVSVKGAEGANSELLKSMAQDPTLQEIMDTHAAVFLQVLAPVVDGKSYSSKQVEELKEAYTAFIYAAVRINGERYLPDKPDIPRPDTQIA